MRLCVALFYFVTASAVFLCTPLTVYSADPAELTKLKEAYELHRGRLFDGIKDLDEKYIAALKRLGEVKTKAGDLESVVAVKNELEAHGDGSKYDENSFRERLSNFEGIRSLQKTYLDARKEIEKANQDKVLELDRLYADQLETLVAELTKSYRIDDAVAVRTELERLGKSGNLSDGNAKPMGLPSEEEKEVLKARAHVTAKAEVQVYLNGEEIFLRTDNPDDGSGTDGKSRFFDLREGDVILVRARGTAVYRSVALAIELPDKNKVIFFQPDDMKVLGQGKDVDLKEFDAKTVAGKPANHPEKILPDSYWVQRWEDHRLDGGEFLKPDPQGEWVIWGCVLTETILER